jgi:hypothetical protein
MYENQMQIKNLNSYFIFHFAKHLYAGIVDANRKGVAFCVRDKMLVYVLVDVGGAQKSQQLFHWKDNLIILNSNKREQFLIGQFTHDCKSMTENLFITRM